MMKTILLMALLWPVLAMAQEVKPVLSADYLALIKNDSLLHFRDKMTDTTNSMRLATMRLAPGSFPGQSPVKKITVGNDHKVRFQPVANQYISFSGTVSSRLELQQANRQAELQHGYVQGRPVNGKLQWNGPGTGEMFSYGPAAAGLEYDGASNPYDKNGNLVPAGSGNGIPARIYSNNVLGNAILVTDAITFNTKYYKNNVPVTGLTIKTGQGWHQGTITGNKNRNNFFAAAADGTIKGLSVNAAYNYRQERFAHSNRAGFLNRVYQSSLLAPVSFDTRQGTTLGTGQRSFSPFADNALFLLADPDHRFVQRQQTGSLSVTRKLRYLQLRLTQSIEKLQQESSEGLQHGTAFFQDGVMVNRAKTDNNYVLNANVAYTLPTAGGGFRAQTVLNYTYTGSQSRIEYNNNAQRYRYQRSVHDMLLSFVPEYNGRNIEAKLVLASNMYLSNTSTRNRFLMPAISGVTRFYGLFGISSFSMKLSGSYTRTNSELPVDQSLATSSQVQYAVKDALQYLPVTEVISFKNLDPIENREYSGCIEMQYRNLSLSADFFNREKANDVFTVINSGQMTLANMATHRYRGIEIEFIHNVYMFMRTKLNIYNSASFISYQSKVLHVKDNYNYTALAGFKDVHKTLVDGEVLGAIVGSSWLRDADHRIMIGADGFPIVNNTPTVIGNPNPDFIMKFSHRLSYNNKWGLNINWEWRKGGDVWNGTRALLDYYGRSAGTGTQRNIENYVFEGVTVNGSHNTQPVSFSSPSLPLDQNRWVRYGYSGVAESYIEKGDYIRLNTVAISWRPGILKYPQQVSFSLYADNIIIWSPYKGADPVQLFNDQPGSSGLDFFNLPSSRSFGASVSLQF